MELARLIPLMVSAEVRLRGEADRERIENEYLELEGRIRGEIDRVLFEHYQFADLRLTAVLDFLSPLRSCLLALSKQLELELDEALKFRSAVHLLHKSISDEFHSSISRKAQFSDSLLCRSLGKQTASDLSPGF